MKTSFGFFFKRHLQDVFKTSWWRRTYSYQSYVSKTSWSRPIYWSCPFVFKTSSRRFQDIFKTSCHNVFKTFSRRLQDVLPKRLQEWKQRTRETFVLMKTSFGFFFKRHLQDVFKTSWWRRTYSYQSYVSKTSWSRPIYWSCPFVFKTSSRRFQDIFKTSCHNVFKTFSRRLQDVLPKRLQDVSQIRLEDIFKTFWRRIIKLNCFC